VGITGKESFTNEELAEMKGHKCNNAVSTMCVACRVSRVVYRVSCIACRVSRVVCRKVLYYNMILIFAKKGEKPA
jgi:hypothetical protein